ncbi:beta-lactamase-like protein [Phycomyces nitens]|nr:beta-lactamase-like protein [Phycomyces nitens]
MTEALVSLPTFGRLSERVWRVLGLNPGKFTLQGTNTYLVGKGPQKILIDSGQGMPNYIKLLEDSLKSISPDAYISDVLLTHGHHDHCGGVDGLLSSSINKKHPIKFHKYPLPFGADRTSTSDLSLFNINPLVNNQIFTAESATLKVIYTPGHTKDHCTLWLEEEKSLFSADCALGQGTAVFENLSEYICGLEYLATLNPIQLYPGHGPVVKDGVKKLKELVHHRQERENQIVALLKSDQKKAWSAFDMVGVLYKDYPESLHLPAVRGILLHLEKLRGEDKVKISSPLTVGADISKTAYDEWTLVA